MVRVLNAVPKFSVKESVLTAARVWLLHWLSEVALLAEAMRPADTNATVELGLEMDRPVLGVIEIASVIAPGTSTVDNGAASARMLVIRKTRVPPVAPGGSTGTPKNVTEFPLAIPWNTFLPCVVPPTSSVATGDPPMLPAYSVHPTSGVGQRLCDAWGPKFGTVDGSPEPGSSIRSNASEMPFALPAGRRRLVTAVFRSTCMLTWGIAVLAASGLPPVQDRVMSPVGSD